MLKLFWSSVLLVEADEITHKGYTFSSKLRERHWTGVPRQSSTEMKLLKNDVKGVLLFIEGKYVRWKGRVSEVNTARGRKENKYTCLIKKKWICLNVNE